MVPRVNWEKLTVPAVAPGVLAGQRAHGPCLVVILIKANVILTPTLSPRSGRRVEVDGGDPQPSPAPR